MTEPHVGEPDLLHDAEEFRFRTTQLATSLTAAGDLVRDVKSLGADFDARFNGSRIPMQVVDAAGRFVRVNRAFSEFLDLPATELVGTPWAEVVHELDHDHDDPMVGRTPHHLDASRHQVITRYLHSNGEIVWAWLVVAPIRSEDATTEFEFGQLVDVTPHIEVLGGVLAARHELASHDERYRSLVLPGADPVLRVNTGGVVIDSNDAAKELLGIDGYEELRIDDFVPRAARLRLRRMISDAVEGGRSQQLERQRLRIADLDDSRWFVIRVVPELSGGRGGSAHLVLGDVTGGVETERRLTTLALTDQLTGIANRAAVYDRLDRAMRRLQRRRDTGVALLAIDMDDFKTMNDVYGHAFGDAALVQFAERAAGAIRDIDTVGRLGGDEFLVILEDTASVADARRAAERIDALLNPFPAALDGVASVDVSISMGLAWTSQPVAAASLVAAADERLLLAKRNGRGRLWLPDEIDDVAIDAVQVSRRELIGELREAIDHDQFVLHYQPLVDRAGTLVAVEALVRWQHPRRGLLLPDAFVPLLIETGEIASVGTWVMETAIAQLARWRESAGSSVRLNINASAGEIGRPEYRRALHETLERAGVEPSAVNVELTEQALSGSAVSESALRELTSFGVNLVLDDFGTGISSLAHLRTRALSGVKIDRSFVSDTENGDIDRRIVRGVTRLAHEVGVEVTAEGVETAEQSEWICSIGCDYLQGFYFGRPAGPDDITELVAGREPLVHRPDHPPE